MTHHVLYGQSFADLVSGNKQRRATERNLTDKGVRGVLGGALRHGDPRRFLVEAMVGAMNADGVVDPREVAVLERHLAEHDLFQGVSEGSARTMIELAVDAVTFAGGPHARIPAIARGLPSRIHRVTGYAMACEVVKADDDVTQTEVAFLELLRQHLRVGAHEGIEIAVAVDERRIGHYLDQRVERIRALAPFAAELFALRAHALGRVSDDHRLAVRDFFLAMPDLAASVAEIEGQLYAAFKRPRPVGFTVHGALQELAVSVPDVVDRWWLTLYALVAEAPENRSWRKVLFTTLVQFGFGLADHDMDLAGLDAQMFTVSVR